jgi:3-hydroxyacyl-CoA dehydrogenase
MPLVEIVRTDKTDPGVIVAMNDFVRKTGKTSVDCKDTPGFIVNRLLIPYLVQAVRDAPPTFVDRATRFVNIRLCCALLLLWSEWNTWNTWNIFYQQER